MKRYDPEADHYGGCDMCGAIMTEKKDGDYILFEDYEKEKSNGIKPELCDGWRDVREELPEIGVAVLIMVTCLSYHNIEQGTYKGGDEWVNCWFSIRDKESYPVTHWMPLPDPPAFA